MSWTVQSYTYFHSPLACLHYNSEYFADLPSYYTWPFDYKKMCNYISSDSFKNEIWNPLYVRAMTRWKRVCLSTKSCTFRNSMSARHMAKNSVNYCRNVTFKSSLQITYRFVVIPEPVRSGIFNLWISKCAWFCACLEFVKIFEIRMDYADIHE